MAQLKVLAQFASRTSLQTTFRAPLIVGGCSIQQRNYSSLQMQKTQQLCNIHKRWNLMHQQKLKEHTYEGHLDYFLFNQIAKICMSYMHFIQDLTGLGWCGTILLGVLPIRVGITVFMRYVQVKNSIKLSEVNLETMAFAEKLKTDMALNKFKHGMKDKKESKDLLRYFNRQVRNHRRDLQHERNTGAGRSVMAALLPVPLWASISIGLRTEVGRPLLDTYLEWPFKFRLQAEDTINPCLYTDGILWFQNLVVPDPYHILPIMSAASMVLLMEGRRLVTHKANVPLELRKQQIFTNFIMNAVRVWHVVFIGIIWNLPALVQFYWCSSALLTFIVNMIIMHPAIEKRVFTEQEYKAGLKSNILVEKPYRAMANNLMITLRLRPKPN